MFYLNLRKFDKFTKSKVEVFKFLITVMQEKSFI